VKSIGLAVYRKSSRSLVSSRSAVPTVRHSRRSGAESPSTKPRQQRCPVVRAYELMLGRSTHSARSPRCGASDLAISTMSLRQAVGSSLVPGNAKPDPEVDPPHLLQFKGAIGKIERSFRRKADVKTRRDKRYQRRSTHGERPNHPAADRSEPGGDHRDRKGRFPKPEFPSECFATNLGQAPEPSSHPIVGKAIRTWRRIQ